jgi:hypothetical protein
MEYWVPQRAQNTKESPSLCHRESHFVKSEPPETSLIKRQVVAESGLKKPNSGGCGRGGADDRNKSIAIAISE